MRGKLLFWTGTDYQEAWKREKKKGKKEDRKSKGRFIHFMNGARIFDFGYSVKPLYDGLICPF